MTAFIDDDGNELDYNGKDFAITKQLISFHDFKIKGNASVNIKVTNTAHNRETFGYYGERQISPVVKKRFNLVQDGNKIDTGDCVISNFDKDEIEFFFISGNSNLLDLIDFKCNEITTTRWDVRNMASTWSNTEGIIYPIIDWVFGGEKYGYVFYSGLTVNEKAYDGLTSITEFVPCLYVHTLLKEISVHAGISIDGDLLDDGFFRTIIISPNSVDDVRQTILGGIRINNIVKPEHIAPNIKVIDFLKWISISFGTLITFDLTSNSITLSMLKTINKSDAQDWSSYYISHEAVLSKYSNKTNIKYKQSDEQNIKQYNNSKEVLYADLQVNSDKNDGSVNNLYTAPFYSSYDKVGTTPMKFATPVGEMFRLTDKEPFAFTSVSASPAVTVVGTAIACAQFNGVNFPFLDYTATPGTELMIFRVGSGIYKGYHVNGINAISGTSSSDTIITSDMAFLGTSSGTLYTQTVQKISGHKVLSVIPGATPSYFCQYPSIYIDSSSTSTVATAYFSKLNTIYSLLNAYTQGLNYGSIDESNRTDKPLSATYQNQVTTILKSPPLKARFLLPKSVFYAYEKEPVYIKTERLTGYFLAEKIENYTESNKEVVVYLVPLD